MKYHPGLLIKPNIGRKEVCNDIHFIQRQEKLYIKISMQILRTRRHRHRKIHRQAYHESLSHRILPGNRENLHKVQSSDTFEAQVDILVTMKKPPLGMCEQKDFIFKGQTLTLSLKPNFHFFFAVYPIIQIMNLICLHQHDFLIHLAKRNRRPIHHEFVPIPNCNGKHFKLMCKLIYISGHRTPSFDDIFLGNLFLYFFFFNKLSGTV